ncbi:MAG: hypothetical protein ACTS73_08520 [Arsenophonus sp. NEOnobi-MAG3]
MVFKLGYLCDRCQDDGWLINEAAFNHMVAHMVVLLNQLIKIDYNHHGLFKQKEIASAALGFVPGTPAYFRWNDNT